MRTIHRSLPAVAGIVLSLALVAQAAADGKQGRLSGNVMNISKDKSEIVIRYGTAGRVVEYNSATAFTAGAVANSKTTSPASFDDVALGTYLTCVGSWDGVKLAATKCTVRPAKRP